MAFRGNESPMDFEWQGHGPVDPTSPFHKIVMENQRKRTHAQLESPQKPSVPDLRAPNSQPWFFSDAPAPTHESMFRSPSFTTPRKPVDVDFSSAGEDSPASQADNEQTPNASNPISFDPAGNSTHKRNSLFGIYGRFAPVAASAPGRGEIKKPASSALAKRIYKKRRRAQNFERQLARRSSDDTSDDDARPGSSDSIQAKSGPKVEEVGWLTGLFTFIHRYPDAPSIIAKYLQVFFNAIILGGCVYMIWSFYATIRADVDRASDEAMQEVLAEMAACSKNYVENRCGAENRLPALETVCSNWELCMNRDPSAVKRARLSAHTFAEIFNSFVEPISLKTMLFTVLVVGLGLLINNATFTLYRRSQDHHYSGAFRYPNDHSMHNANIGHFPMTPGVGYEQMHQVDWHANPTPFRTPFPQSEQRQLGFQGSPTKDYLGRSRSRSPEKKRVMR